MGTGWRQGMLTVGVVVLAAVAAGGAQRENQAQPLPKDGPECLHGANESPSDAARREEALRAMRLVFAAARENEPGRGALMPWYPNWTELARTPAVERLRAEAGAAGELARRLRWGTDEPLPGWEITYQATRTDVRFALTDRLDPCRFTYSSVDPRVVPPVGRIRPLM